MHTGSENCPEGRIISPIAETCLRHQPRNAAHAHQYNALGTQRHHCMHRFQHSQRQPQHAKCNRTLPGHTTTVPVSPRLGPSKTDRNSDDAPRLGALPLHRQAERPPQTNLLNFDPNTGRDCSPDHQTRVPLPGHRSTHTPFPTEVESGKDHSRSSTTQCVAAKLLNLDPAGRMFFSQARSFTGPSAIPRRSDRPEPQLAREETRFLAKGPCPPSRKTCTTRHPPKRPSKLSNLGGARAQVPQHEQTPT